ncbi:hypothetical protein CO2235_150141 [Cupriavidus oxalaticus]|uniref:Uncharacterized protein n=1 Tax=Cupriavidus oxalaticus TaxID=96344 RepID=A0A375G381_9BURK|nr:hypothetical protein CO2235_U590104 [Cupriavidus oxalaticus]SPC12486.1 hypothetical protein CO2235_150141 [Cupriavidus oxalaticus]
MCLSWQSPIGCHQASKFTEARNSRQPYAKCKRAFALHPSRLLEIGSSNRATRHYAGLVATVMRNTFPAIRRSIKKTIPYGMAKSSTEEHHLEDDSLTPPPRHSPQVRRHSAAPGKGRLFWPAQGHRRGSGNTAR